MNVLSRYFLFFLFVLAFVVGPFSQSLDKAKREYGDVAVADWGATNVWLKSVECFRQTGAWLAICGDGGLQPIADHALADDPGHALLLAAKAKIQGRSQTVADVAKLNLWINFGALVLMGLLLMQVGSGLAALLYVLVGGYAYPTWVGVSPHPAIIGVATLAAILPLALLLKANGLLSNVRWLVLSSVGIGALAVASLVREPVGTMGFLMTLLVGAWALVRWRASGWAGAAAVLLVIVAAAGAWKVSAPLLAYRDAAFGVRPAQLVQAHGTSHNLFIGLGAVPNKWGIRWDDSYGDQAVKAVDPAIRYVSHEYYAVLRQLYLEKVLDDPFEVGRIYAVKARELLGQKFPHRFLPLWLSLAIAVGLFLWRARKPGSADPHRGLSQAVTVIGLGFVGLFVLQGALASQGRPYAEPISAFILMIVSVLAVEVFSRSHLSRPLSTPRPG
jgi:hypothetical protein